MPAEAGIQGKRMELAPLDSRFRGNDKKEMDLTITPSPISEVLTEPMADAADEAVRLLANDAARPRQFGIHGDGIGEETGGGGEGRTAGRLGETADAQRPPHADLLIQHQRGQFAHARELAGAAGEHDAAAGDLIEAALL